MSWIPIPLTALCELTAGLIAAPPMELPLPGGRSWMDEGAGETDEGGLVIAGELEEPGAMLPEACVPTAGALSTGGCAPPL